eukprot:CAMPEP_0170587178 /NCGR_PEP_ID=MMETSP0224-20130122/10146_1 /TAXON_ID=285029 /ORGANISM="Togula jolla, Strain CCCM 725" /LENGTH=245 /DNA_ID=CAMNT_0010910787 /DNA_START=142 /DNA_END=879 /DNA_ORIENTATION=+
MLEKIALFRLLNCREIFQLQAVHSSWRLASSSPSLWRLCLAQGFPNITVDFLPEGENQAKLLSCLLLSRVCVLAEGAVLRLSSAEEVQTMISAIQEAKATAESHLADGGRVARVAIGCFYMDAFSEHSVPELSPVTSFALGPQGPGGSRGRLQLRLGHGPEGLLIAATHSRFAALKRIGTWRIKTAEILIDLASTSGASLRCRRVRVLVDGKFTELREINSPRNDADRGKSVNCVLCLREGRSLA